MSLSALRRVFLGKRETTYGVDAVPTGAADALLVFNDAEIQPLNQEVEERSLLRGPFYGNFQQVPTRREAAVTLMQEVAGFGTAGPASPTAAYDAALRACGLARTINAGVSVVYSPVSSAFDSMTLGGYTDGMLNKLTGARGNLKFSMKRGTLPKFTYEMRGIYNDPTDVALPNPTISAYQVPLPVNVLNTSAFALHGFSNACLESLEFDMGNELQHRDLINCTDQIQITDRKSKGKLVIEWNTVGVKDWLSLIKNATLGALSITHGTTAGNKVKFDASNVQLANPKYDKQDNIVMMAFDLILQPSSAGNDEFTLTIL
jgi:hypothetical protein